MKRIVKICVWLFFGALFIVAGLLGNRYVSSIDECPFMPSENEAFQVLDKFIDAEYSGNIEALSGLYTEKARRRFDEWVASRGPEVVERFLQKKMKDVALINYTGGGMSGNDCGRLWVMVSFQSTNGDVISQSEYHLEATATDDKDGGTNRKWQVAFVLPVDKMNNGGEVK